MGWNVKVEVLVCTFGVAVIALLVLFAESRGHDGWVCVSGCGVIGTIIGYMFRGARNGKPCRPVDPTKQAESVKPARKGFRKLSEHWLFSSVPRATVRR